MTVPHHLDISSHGDNCECCEACGEPFVSQDSVIIDLVSTKSVAKFSYDNGAHRTLVLEPKLQEFYEFMEPFSEKKVHDVALAQDSALILFRDGSTDICGYPDSNPMVQYIRENLRDVKRIVGTTKGFAALRNNGEVASWSINSLTPGILNDVAELHATEGSFIAVHRNRSLRIWSHPKETGGKKLKFPRENIKTVFTCQGSKLAAFMYSNGGVASYNDRGFTNNTKSIQMSIKDAEKIFVNKRAIAVLCKDTRVVSWDCFGKPFNLHNLTKVKSIAKTDFAFAALKFDGTVRVWGDADTGGHLPRPLHHVTEIVESQGAFLAILQNKNGFLWPKRPGDGLPENIQIAKSTITGFILVGQEQEVVVSGHYDTSIQQADLGTFMIVSETLLFFHKLDGTLMMLDKSPRKIPKNPIDITCGEEYFKLTFQDAEDTYIMTNEDMEQYKPMINRKWSGVKQFVKIMDVFVILFKSGIAEVWEFCEEGDDIYRKCATHHNIKQLISNEICIAIMDNSGTVTCWDPDEPQTRSIVSNVRELHVSYDHFVALCNDGTVVLIEPEGTEAPANFPISLTGVKAIFVDQMSSQMVFSYTDGSFAASGFESAGKKKRKNPNIFLKTMKNVCDVKFSESGTTVLCENGDAASWLCCGKRFDVKGLDKNVKKIAASQTMFAALKTDGSVLTWFSGRGKPEPLGDFRCTDLAGCESVVAAIGENNEIKIWHNEQVITHEKSASKIFANRNAILVLDNEGSVNFIAGVPFQCDLKAGTIFPAETSEYGFFLDVDGNLTVLLCPLLSEMNGYKSAFLGDSFDSDDDSDEFDDHNLFY